MVIMALLERPTGKADLFIIDTSYRRPDEVEREFGRHLKNLDDFSSVSDEDLDRTVNHAEGLNSLLRAGRVDGNPKLVAVEETVLELDAGNDRIKRKLRALKAPDGESDIKRRLSSAMRYVHLMETLADNLRATNPKQILKGRAKLYLPQFLRATQGFYEDVSRGQKQTFGGALGTDARTVAAAGAAVYQMGIDHVIVLTRDTKHIVEMLFRMKEKLFLGEDGKKYGIMHKPNKDFSINAYSCNVPWLFDKGFAVKPELN